MPTFVTVPKAGMHARVANAVAAFASARVGSKRGVGKEGTKACPRGSGRVQRIARQVGERKRTAQQPTTRPYICTPASARATEAAVTPLSKVEGRSARRRDEEGLQAHAEMSASLPSDSRIVKKRSICDLGRASRIREGRRDCWSVAESELDSVSYSTRRGSSARSTKSYTSTTRSPPCLAQTAAHPRRRA